MEVRAQTWRKRSTVLMLAASGLVFAGSATAARHLRLVDSLPKQDQAVSESPEEVRVWFNQTTTLAVSRLQLEGPEGKVKVGKVQATDDPKSFKAPVGDTLLAGTYTVGWRTAGPDGHVQRGEFSFSVVDTERR